MLLKDQFAEFSKYAHNVYRMNDLIRFNDSQRIRHETVAAHSYFVSLMTLKLYDYYKFDLLKALQMAITHDLIEIELTDIVHRVKKEYPAIDIASLKSEEKAMKKVMNETQCEIHADFIVGKSNEAKVVLLADIMSCLQYVDSEISLGNNGYIKDIRVDILDRLKDCIKNMRDMEI